MGAGLGFKDFTTGEVLTSADVDGYLMQGVWVFANAAARTAAVTSPQEGNASFLKDTNALEIYDGAAWVAYGAGDITGVTAGTGISGGGTSGTVTVTNSMATTIDAKGDLIVGTGADTFDRLAVGTNDYVLTAASGETTGMKWSAVPTANFTGCRIFNSTDTAIANNTTTAYTCNSESFDTDGYHSTATNTSRITIPAGKGGKYLLTAKLEWYSNNTGARYVGIGLNGGNNVAQFNTAAVNNQQTLCLTTLANLSVGDYVEMFAYQTSGGNLSLYGRTDLTYFEATYLGA